MIIVDDKFLEGEPEICFYIVKGIMIEAFKRNKFKGKRKLLRRLKKLEYKKCTNLKKD